MSLKNSLKRAISEEKDKLKDKEVFLSDAFREFAESLLRGVGKIYSIPTFRINVFWGDENGIVANCSEDCEFNINANNVYVKGLKRKERFSALIGCLCHEVSHRLWTDFKESKRIANQIIAGCVQSYEGKALNGYLQNFPAQRKAVAKLFLKIHNIIEDAAIEKMFAKTYMGYRKYLIAMRQIASANERAYSETHEESDDVISNFISLLLANAVNGYDPVNIINPEARDAYEFLESTINAAIIETNAKKRCAYCVTIVSDLIDFLQEKEEEKKNNQNQQSTDNNSGDSGSDNSSSSDSSSDSSDSSSDSDSNENSGAGSSSDSEEDNSSQGNQGSASGNDLNISDDMFSGSDDNVDSNYSPLEDGDENDSSSMATKPNSTSDGVQDHGDCSNELSQVENNLAQQKVEKQQEKELQKQCNTLKDNMDFGQFHKNISSTVNRIENTTKPKNFEQLDKECDTVLKRLIKEWAKQIHDLQIGDNMNGLYSGRRLTQAYRTDLKRFSSKKAPSDIPNMSICLLMDISASMWGESASAAKKSAMLIYKFCQELNIRFCCYGHQTGSGSKVKLSSFAEFDSIDGKDLIRIANLEDYVDGCNRDGYALRYCAEKLSKEQAAQKLLIITSDGAPNDYGYGFYYQPTKSSQYKLEDSGNAKLDIMEIEKICAKSGISLVTAGIGEASETIKDLYEYGVSKKIAPQFLEITDLNKMPKRFIEILKKEIDKQR
jgi:nitric oxide reductase activation protein